MKRQKISAEHAVQDMLHTMMKKQITLMMKMIWKI